MCVCLCVCVRVVINWVWKSAFNVLLMVSGRGQLGCMSDHVMEREATCGASKMCWTVHGCVSIRRAKTFFSPTKAAVGNSQVPVAVNDCVVIWTQSRDDCESFLCHPFKSSAFLYNDMLTPSSTVQTRNIDYHVSLKFVKKKRKKKTNREACWYFTDSGVLKKIC